MPIVNVDQASAWDGDEGAYWTVYEQRHNDAVRAHSDRLMAAAKIAPRERVLDLGCGCGETTRDAARAAAPGDGVGIDLSLKMLERARARAAEEGVGNVTFVHGDAQVYPFGAGAFDVVISRMGAMFFADPVAAFTNVGAATRPGGRMVLAAWQAPERNEWSTALRGALAMGRDLPAPPSGTPGPFGLADPDRVRSMLTAAGFHDVELDDVQAPFWLGPDADDAHAFVEGIGVVRGLLEDLDVDDARRALDVLRRVIEAHETDDGVVFDSRAWMIRAVR